MTNRKELEEVIREAVSCVLEGCGDKETVEEENLGESSQSGSTQKKTPEAYRLRDTSGNFGEKGKIPSYAKKYSNANAGVRSGTKRQLNKKDRQAAKKELDEAIATVVRGVLEGCKGKENLDEVSPPGREDQVKTLKGELPATYKDKETGETKESNPWAVAWSSFAKGKKEE